MQKKKKNSNEYLAATWSAPKLECRPQNTEQLWDKEPRRRHCTLPYNARYEKININVKVM